jgi:hypothetical protein
MNITLNITLDDASLAAIATLLSKAGGTPTVTTTKVPKNKLVHGTWTNTYMRLGVGKSQVFSSQVALPARRAAGQWNMRYGKYACATLSCRKSKDGSLTVTKVAK